MSVARQLHRRFLARTRLDTCKTRASTHELSSDGAVLVLLSSAVAGTPLRALRNPVVRRDSHANSKQALRKLLAWRERWQSAARKHASRPCRAHRAGC